MQIFIHRGKSKALDCGCGGKTADGPREELEALEKEMRETEEKYTDGTITKEKWDEFRRRYVAERHRLTVAMREPSTGRIGYASAGARRQRGDAKTLDPPKSEAQRRAMWADALTPAQYIKQEYASGRIPAVNIDYIAKSYYLCDKDFNILSGIGYDTRQEAEIARSKLLDQGRKNSLANA